MKKPSYEKDNFKIYVSEWEQRDGVHKLSQALIFPKNTYSPWLDAEFQEFYDSSVMPNSLVDIYRCFELDQLCKQLKSVEGDIIEVGVWRGGTALILQKGLGVLDSLILCDTFEGVVKAGQFDNLYRGGEHSDTSLEHVKSLFTGKENVKILKGIFPEESSQEIEKNVFKFCHIDVDVYQSAKDIFEWIFPRLISSGIVVFDDYGFAACEGVTLFVNELSNRKDLIVTYNLNGHAVVFKK